MKRIISIILAAAMMLSLSPSVFATEGADEPIEIVYDFAGKFTASMTFGKAKGDNWEIAGFKDSTTDTTMDTKVGNGDKISRSSNYNAIRVSATDEGKYWVAFELTLDKAARYSLTVNAVAAKTLSESGAYVDAYLFKKSTVSSIEEGITDQNKFSSSNFTQVSTEEELSFDKEEYLTAGEYYFVYSPMVTGGSGGWVTLLSLTLNGTMEEEGQNLALTDFFTNANDQSGTHSCDGTALSWEKTVLRRYAEGGISGSADTVFGAMKFSVNEAGDYSIKFKTDNPTEASIAPLVAIGKYNSELEGATAPDLFKDATELGYFNFSAAEAGKYAPITADGSADGEKSKIYLDRGDYYILFIGDAHSFELNPYARNMETGEINKIEDITNYDGDYGQEMYLSGIKLVPRILSVSFYAEKEALNRGETAKAGYRLSYNDGEEYTGESSVYYYESENPTVASISQDGVITAKSAGKTNVILLIEADGNMHKGIIPISVVDPFPLERAEIYGDNTVEAGFATRLSVKATHEGGKAANLEACTVEFSLADEADAEYLEVKQNGEITGKKEKDEPVNVIVTVTCGEYKITSADFPITVTPNSPKSQLIDFRKPGSGYALNVSIDDYGWEINTKKTATAICSAPSSKLRCFTQAVQAQITAVGKTQDADLAIEVWVNYTGWYNIDFRGVNYYRGAQNAVLYMDGKYMGDFNFWTDISTNRKYNTLVPLNTMYLTEGRHTFTLRAMTRCPAETGKYAYLLPAYLSLEYIEGTGGMDEIVFSADRTNLAVGQSSDISASLIMQGGREYKFGKNHSGKTDKTANLVLSSSDEKIVSIDDGVITAVSPGEATITATATIGDDTIEESIVITVNEETLSHLELAYDVFDIHVGSEKAVKVKAYLTNGERFSNDILEITYDTLDDTVAVCENGSLKGLKLGTTEMTVTAAFGDKTVSKTVQVNVIEDGFADVLVTAPSKVLMTGGEGTDVAVSAYDNNGNLLDISDAVITYISDNESVISVDEEGHVTPISEGVAKITATVSLDGITHSGDITLSSRKRKVSSTYYTAKRVANARENIQKYDWARDTAEAAIEEADKYLPYYDYIYNMIPAHTLPRAYDLVETDDPFIWRCFYCGIDLNYKYGKYAWKIDAIARPWKIQCPDCKRLFPSNDFGAYYERGLDEHGEFDYTLAREENGILCGRGERNKKGEYVVFDWAKDNPYGYGDPKGNLYNETYTDLHAAGAVDPFYGNKITQGWGDFKTGGESGVPTSGYFWGVDDGFGYDTGRYNDKSGTKVKNVHRYIAVFAHDGLWYGSGSVNPAVIRYALNAFREAYVYTGDKKYGIAGAIILDRIADLYPDMDYGKDCPNLQSSHDGGGNGKVVGRIWENAFNKNLTMAYDAFFDVYDEQEVINYLSAKAEQWDLDNKKTNGELIRQNAEKNLLEETYTALKTGKIMGNFGMRQDTLAKAAVILDSQPETQEMIDFIYQSGVSSQIFSSGGDMRSALINQIDRDGYGDESSMGYLRSWNSYLLDMAYTFEEYPGLRDEDNLLKNPKFIKMLLMSSDLILTGNNTPNIGDNSGTFGGARLPVYSDEWLEGFRLSKNPIFAQLLWYTNGNTAEGLHYDIFTKDPESPQPEIEAAIEEHGELELSKSSISTGYGFAALRNGVMYDKVTTPTRTNTMRDWWMYFGGAATTHKHMDALNLGIDAFGMELAPDLGYFSSSGGTGTTQGANWIESTLSHNTVLVNDTPQVRIKQAGYPYHFEDAGSIKLMDIDAPQAYPDVTDTYRRTVVSIDIDDSVSYALDFFRIVGGDEHLYSFHTQSEESVIEGVEMVAQPKGTYAGINVPFGEDVEYTATNGFNWLANVERASAPETGEFSIDFKISDYQKVLREKRNLHVKLTQLNGFEISEVARADGQPVQHIVNPEWIDYLLVRRSGKDLDTLFTSVIEPYEDESKINKLSRVDVKRKDGKALRFDEPVAAIRVELKNGRTDYVVYADDNETTYEVTDAENGVSFDFCGFVGVYSVSADDSSDVVRTYLYDGKTLGEVIQNKDAAVTGEIVSFTETLEFKNFIEVTLNESIDPQALVGRMIVINNDGGQNGSYIIKSAEKKGDNVLIGTGDVTLIRSLTADGNDYVMNIAKGDTYRIPLTHTTDNAPEIGVSGTFTTSAGSSIKIPLNVTSDREYTLIGTSLPRGMSINAEAGVLTWKPDASQVGDNHVAVTVDNGVLSDTVHFAVTVYGATTGETSADKTESSSTGNTDTPAGGGGGGGGAAPTDKPEDETNTGETDTSGESGENGGNTDNAGTENSSLRFTDLANCTWAADAINALAADGIIKGTTASTFSPASNITRADFALLLVRAFGLESENTENFADVSINDYFATELAIARNNGIISGIGDNKFAPRNTITRQDMMVIVYRALSTMEKEFDTAEISAPDFENVAEYAKDAVSALVNTGLVNGKNGRISPTDYTTRAEVAVLIKRILDYVK